MKEVRFLLRLLLFILLLDRYKGNLLYKIYYLLGYCLKCGLPCAINNVSLPAVNHFLIYIQYENFVEKSYYTPIIAGWGVCSCR